MFFHLTFQPFTKLPYAEDGSHLKILRSRWTFGHNQPNIGQPLEEFRLEPLIYDAITRQLYDYIGKHGTYTSTSESSRFDTPFPANLDSPLQASIWLEHAILKEARSIEYQVYLAFESDVAFGNACDYFKDTWVQHIRAEAELFHHDIWLDVSVQNCPVGWETSFPPGVFKFLWGSLEKAGMTDQVKEPGHAQASPSDASQLHEGELRFDDFHQSTQENPVCEQFADDVHELPQTTAVVDLPNEPLMRTTPGDAYTEGYIDEEEYQPMDQPMEQSALISNDTEHSILDSPIESSAFTYSEVSASSEIPPHSSGVSTPRSPLGVYKFPTNLARERLDRGFPETVWHLSTVVTALSASIWDLGDELQLRVAPHLKVLRHIRHELVDQLSRFAKLEEESGGMTGTEKAFMALVAELMKVIDDMRLKIWDLDMTCQLGVKPLVQGLRMAATEMFEAVNSD
ncbi:hypothetical protein SAICODRAFT_17572 [Saitoella complicata NRRL Y-17804]|uniref:Uncharacterized protein n=1 Tax=Saitoella complicata (strain BCRC 22490 / CBS 7301 / JCM 7358 / NBRC 10748 / NRRL Y-17804) TaxID=698492 RepID=A0A0E9NJJ2_SAICN|nr:uncharacterized protein SAICODRAFT_17572 [Saitoella complicata NRRL Y-17804]ODQ55173.1 hypothetical protein SAICODRAFT_17572 [Saitoella complicata NRRL Y-17804]GAO49973.1 hypothetical protein G7K_4108-t1 [Saitoella complicata NRRL Y-17804]